MKKRSKKNETPVLFLRGSTELGMATRITDKHEHAKWRAAGLKYIKIGKAFYYDPNEVSSFLKKFYAIQKVKQQLLESDEIEEQNQSLTAKKRKALGSPGNAATVLLRASR